jgi:hypothetical protein
LWSECERSLAMSIKELNKCISDDPLRQLVKSTSLIAVLNDKVEGAWWRLDGKEFHALMDLYMVDDSSALEA